ncbi:hypothetical protein BJ912DRAFT_273544 [Pholiota molesta]|nr:hypothetical protein BJ912DRAFT_273544 [Pholiota molesta]
MRDIHDMDSILLVSVMVMIILTHLLDNPAFFCSAQAQSNSTDSIPEIASCGRVMTLAEYVHVGALSVMTWDVLNHCKEDYHLLFSFDPCVHATLYAVTRYMTLAYVLAKTLYLTIQIPHCNMLGSAIAAFYISPYPGRSCRRRSASGSSWTGRRTCSSPSARCGSSRLGQRHVCRGGRRRAPPAPLGLGAEDAAAADACVDQIKGEYVALAFIVLFVYHACLLVAVGLAIQQNVFADRPGCRP